MQVMLLECDWNFLPHYCHSRAECKSPLGISAIHAANETFGAESFEPVYSTIFQRYEEIEAKNMSLFSWSQFLREIEEDLKRMARNSDSASSCSMSSTFTQNFLRRMMRLMFQGGKKSSCKK
jgi:hypothetical protein